MGVHVFPLDSGPVRTFTALYDRPYSLWLDSAMQGHSRSRYSYIAFHPKEIIECKNGLVSVSNRDEQLSFRADPFKIVQERLKAANLSSELKKDLPPFQGGLAGYFGYDLARQIEKLPSRTKDNVDLPDLSLGIYDQVVAYDHKARKGWHIIHAENEDLAKRKHIFLRQLINRIDRPPQGVLADLDWYSDMDQEDYTANTQKILDHIRAGDIFQANISQRFGADLPSDFNSFGHYIQLRRVNPAPYAAYMNFGAFQVASASPECFLELNDRHVETNPIKGTVAADSDPAIDKLNVNALANSTKNRAENAMIVDLLRNDLSRVCEDTSIETKDLYRIESFAGVHHMVSTVTGKLRKDFGALDLLRACFPGGSITGAPKVRAMEIIESIESERRGVYCGAIGFIGANGAMNTNIAIRTVVYNKHNVTFNVGSGIVADSDPAEEYRETLTKARKIFESFRPAQQMRRAG